MRLRFVPICLLMALVAAGCFDVSGFGDISFSVPFKVRLGASSIDKVDLLLVIDESRSTLDKQNVLASTLTRFFGQLLNPRCIDNAGYATADQPSGPLQPCPGGSQREFLPVLDIHIGVITTSLGGHGADACAETTAENWKAHLVDGGVAGYAGHPFLAWDPAGIQDPPGEDDPAKFTADLVTIIASLGEAGCGYEAQLESWYRFLVEPDPHDAISIVDGDAILEGTDQQLLAQRAAFLRPDSLVAIVTLTDEDDCSFKDGGQFYLGAQIYSPGTSQPYHLPPPRAACAVDPNDPCCRSCGQLPGEGCDTSLDQCEQSLDGLEDSINLRCFDQKRRFGIDFLYPIDRYVGGLTQALIADRHGNIVDNPLLRVRDPGLVLLTGIVGVPWQDIARRTAAGKPDLLSGLDAQSRPVGGIQNSTELIENNTWELILGEPSQYVDPTDPLMIASIDPRMGVNPITGDSVAPPGASFAANPINGHEYSTPFKSDLQYACVFELEDERDCTDPEATSCECWLPDNDNPLCQDASTDAFGQTQYRAGAKPGLRHLEVLRAIGTQGVVGSVCWSQIDDPNSDDYGYNPALFRAIIDKLRPSLRAQFCLDRPIVPVIDGAVACTLMEARHIDGGSCDCDAPARRRMTDADKDLPEAAHSHPLFSKEQWNCFCEVVQTKGTDLASCQAQVDEPVVNAVFGYGVDGWCYIDALSSPQVGAPALAAGCDAKQRRLIRIVGKALPAAGASMFLSCR